MSIDFLKRAVLFVAFVLAQALVLGRIHLFNTGVVLTTFNIPYASKLFVNPGEDYDKGQVVCEWDPYKASLVIEQDGKIKYEDVIEGVTAKTETDEQTGTSSGRRRRGLPFSR